MSELLTAYERSILKDSINAKYGCNPECADRKPDNVNHPNHYIQDGIETIDVIKAWTKGLDGIIATDTGNVIKYISRWNKKNGLEDLRKAQWYLNHLIKEMEERMENDCCC